MLRKGGALDRTGTFVVRVSVQHIEMQKDTELRPSVRSFEVWF